MKAPIDFPIILTKTDFENLVREYAISIVQARIGAEAMLVIEIEDTRSGLENLFEIGMWRK